MKNHARPMNCSASSPNAARKNSTFFILHSTFLLLAVASAPAATYTGDPYRGLWIGDVTLKYATEVTVPLNSNNVPIAPNPAVPTPTADQANLRLILHVNGAGSVSLLRE